MSCAKEKYDALMRASDTPDCTCVCFSCPIVRGPL